MTGADFSQIFGEHKDAVYRFAWRMTGSASAAEDVAQGLFSPSSDRAAALRTGASAGIPQPPRRRLLDPILTRIRRAKGVDPTKSRNSYLFNDPGYQPGGDHARAEFLMGAGGRLESLLRP